MFGLLGPNGAQASRPPINILAGRGPPEAIALRRDWGRDIDRRRDARATSASCRRNWCRRLLRRREALSVQAGFYGVPDSERHSTSCSQALGLGDKAARLRPRRSPAA